MRTKLSKGFPIFLASLNMRAGLVLVGPLIPILEKYFGLNNGQLALLAGIPLICFAGTSLVMKQVARIGSSNLIIKWALTTLTIALIARAFTGLVGLYLFSLVMGVSIAVMNYEIPAWVKEHAAEDAGFMTGIYVTLMGLAAATSIAISVPLAESSSLSWRLAMVPWMVIAALTTLYWWGKMKNEAIPEVVKTVNFWNSKAFKSPIAWALVFFFGLESMSFYATATWFPTLLTTKDFTLTQAAIAVSASGLIGSMVGLAVPHYVGKIHDKRVVLTFVSAFTGFSFFMITVQTGAILFLWLSLSNIGISIAFPIALLLTSEKSDTPEATRNLSTMMQSLGYILSSTGPYLMGQLFAVSNNWNIAMYGIVFVTFMQLIMGLIVGKPNKIAY